MAVTPTFRRMPRTVRAHCRRVRPGGHRARSAPAAPDSASLGNEEVGLSGADVRTPRPAGAGRGAPDAPARRELPLRSGPPVPAHRPARPGARASRPRDGDVPRHGNELLAGQRGARAARARVAEHPRAGPLARGPHGILAPGNEGSPDDPRLSEEPGRL